MKLSTTTTATNLQHEALTDNYQLKTLEICCVKLLLRMLVPFLFKWSLLLLRWRALIFLFWTMRKKIFLLHISFKRWLISLPFQAEQTSLRRLQDALKRSRRLTTKQDAVTTSGKKRWIYDVLKVSDLSRLEDVQFTMS